MYLWPVHETQNPLPTTTLDLEVAKPQQPTS
jgi:hypothetical protein